MASCAVVQEMASGIRDCFREKADLSGHGMTMEDTASACVSSAFDPLCMKSYMICMLSKLGSAISAGAGEIRQHQVCEENDDHFAHTTKALWEVS